MNKKRLFEFFITRGIDKEQEIFNENAIKKFWTSWKKI